MQTVAREELLARLKLVQPGLMRKGIIEQGNCFVFRNGKVYTFNEEVLYQTKVGLDIEGAIVAPSFLTLLENMEEEEIGIGVKDDKLLVRGKNKSGRFLFQKQILLPIESVEEAAEWQKLPENFCNGLGLVQECTSKKKEVYALTCVHLHPKHLEATDRYQLARYTVATPLKEPLLVPQSSIKNVVYLEPTTFSVSKSWIHFRTKAKDTILSCRVNKEKFVNCSKVLGEKNGTKTVLPKGLEEAAKRAAILSSENPDNEVKVEIKKDKIRVWGIGITGEYYEDEKVAYDGRPFSFLLPPNLLMELVQKHTECFLSDKLLRVEFSNFVYVTCLGKVEEKNNE